MNKEELTLLIIGLIFVILLISITTVSAGWLENFKNRITGKATDTVTVNVSVGVPEIRYVDNATMTSVSGGLSAGPSNTSVIINFSVYHGGGTGLLNNASARINFTRSGETTRQNASCTTLPGSVSNYINYSCNVTMMWFDSDGTWNIAAYINDTSGNAAVNISMNFSVGQTTGVDIGGLSWATLAPGTTNQTTGEGLLLNNTGNKVITINTTQVNSTNLRGETTNTLALWAGNTSVSWNSSVDSCHSSGGNGTKADNLSTGNYVNVSGANLSRGNYLLNDNSTGQERLYFCIKIVGSDLTAQSYSTLNESSWTIRIL